MSSSSASLPTADDRRRLRTARRRHPGRVLLGVGCAILVQVGVALAAVNPTVFDDYPRPGGFAGSAIVGASGSEVTVGGGGNVCRKGWTIKIDATLSQHSTGAVAEGTWTGTCTGRSQKWHTTAHVTDGVPFTPGCAVGVALGVAHSHGKPISAHQWLSPLTLTNSAGAGGTAPKLTC